MYSFICFVKKGKRPGGAVREFRWSLMKGDVFERLIKELGNMESEEVALLFFSFTERTSVNVKS